MTDAERHRTVLEDVVGRFADYCTRTRRLDGDVVRGYAQEMVRAQEEAGEPFTGGVREIERMRAAYHGLWEHQGTLNEWELAQAMWDAGFRLVPAAPPGVEREPCAACSLIGATCLDYINDPETGVASRALYHEATEAGNHTCGRNPGAALRAAQEPTDG